MSVLDKEALAATVTLCSKVRPAQASQSPGHLLIIEAGSSTFFELPPHGELLIGRAPDTQVRLQDALVSRHHARLVMEGGEAQLVDLGSHNGTRVNGERLSAPRR